MALKRITNQKKQVVSPNNPVQSGSNSFIARQTGGLCFDFHSKDSNIYLVGTEDGQIHRCSCSYNEQYLNTYTSHTGPINRIKWSPFVPSVFMSCSSDWTARLWHQDSEQEIFKFQSGRDSIPDIAWSPHSSTCFGMVTSDGRLEIWDLEYSVLDPAITHSVLDRQFTSINFAAKSPTVATGDDFGAVMLYKLCKAGHEDDDLATSGLVSPYASIHLQSPEAQQWRAEQIQLLNAVIASKNLQ